MERRAFWKAIGSLAAATVPGAGCLDAAPFVGEDAPGAPYARWIAADAVPVDADSVYGITLDASVLEIEDETGVGGAGEREDRTDPEDPLTRLLSVAVFAGGLGSDQASSAVGLGGRAASTGATETPSGTSAGTSTDRIHVVQDGIVLEGRFDADAIGEFVLEDGGDERDEYVGFTLYSREDVYEYVAGVSSDTIVVASETDDGAADPESRVKRTIDAGRGRVTRFGDEHAGFRELVTGLDHRSVMMVSLDRTGEDPDSGGDGAGSSSPTAALDEYGLEGDLRGVSMSTGVGHVLEPVDDSETHGTLVLLYSSPDETDPPETVREAMEPRADDVAIRTDGRSVVASVTYLNEK